MPAGVEAISAGHTRLDLPLLAQLDIKLWLCWHGYFRMVTQL